MELESEKSIEVAKITASMEKSSYVTVEEKAVEDGVLVRVVRYLAKELEEEDLFHDMADLADWKKNAHHMEWSCFGKQNSSQGAHLCWSG